MQICIICKQPINKLNSLFLIFCLLPTISSFLGFKKLNRRFYQGYGE